MDELLWVVESLSTCTQQQDSKAEERDWRDEARVEVCF
jgi:hypothetical protein